MAATAQRALAIIAPIIIIPPLPRLFFEDDCDDGDTLYYKFQLALCQCEIITGSEECTQRVVKEKTRMTKLFGEFEGGLGQADPQTIFNPRTCPKNRVQVPERVRAWT